MDGLPALFGTIARTKVLVTIALLEETYPREIARVAELPLMTVQRAVNDFDTDRVTASRVFGAQRNVRLNPTYFVAKELRTLLISLSAGFPKLSADVSILRRRPRRAGKVV
jgi:hypothetical protein